MSPIEIAGVVVSALAIALTARRKMACWPVGLVSVALYGWIFFDARLYSDMLLQGAFAVMQVYGWWRWASVLRQGAADLTGTAATAATAATVAGTAASTAAATSATLSAASSPVTVQHASWRMLLPALLTGAAGSMALGAMMAHFTNAALPWVDASLSSFSLVAQFWTARKYLASWILWIVVDVIYVGMFVIKDLYPTSLLYAFFVVLAAIGWRDWHRASRLQTDGTAPSAGTAPLFPSDDSYTSSRMTASSNESITRSASMSPARESRGEKQFGVHGEQITRDWPLMIASEVAGVLASYPLSDTLESLSWHSPRPFAAAALATLKSGQTLFIKRHHTRLRDVEALGEEHRFMAHLAERGIPVARVLSDRLGRTAVSNGEWVYEVHLNAEGTDIYRSVMSWEPFIAVSHARAAGAALARLHRAAADYTAPARPPRLLLSSFQVLGSPHLLEAADAWVAAQPLLARALSRRPWRQDIETLVGPHHARLAPFLPDLPSLWTHGDWHASNLLWRGSGDREAVAVQSVFDFGLADRTCAIYDLALAIERNTIEWLVESGQRRVHLDQIDGLLDGYGAVMPLSRHAYAALIALLPIAHIEFALSEVAYFDGILDQPGDADIAYGGYFAGHIRWFDQADGQQVLAHLRRRAAQAPALA